MKKYNRDVAAGMVEEEGLEAIVCGDAHGGITPVALASSATATGATADQRPDLQRDAVHD